MPNEILIKDGVKYCLYDYKDEKELEKFVAEYYKEIFGEKSLCFDVKKKLSTEAGVETIPDFFVISLASQQWYFVEVELAGHGYNHMHTQLSKFPKVYKNSETKQKLVNTFFESVKESPEKKFLLEQNGIEKEVHEFIYKIVINNDPTIIVPIDKITKEVKEACEEYAQIIEFKTFVRKGTEKAEKPVYIHMFEPLYEESELSISTSIQGDIQKSEISEILGKIENRVKEKLSDELKQVVYIDTGAMAVGCRFWKEDFVEIGIVLNSKGNLTLPYL